MLVDGVEVPASSWRTRRARELVLLLALARQHRRVREQVIDTLWPELDGDAGSANLRKAAHFARQALGHADALTLREGLVAVLPSGTVTTDAERFEKAADAALASGAREACLEASALYAGDLLPDAPYEAWIEGPRARLRGKFLQLLRAAGRIEQLAREEPTDEPAHQALMREAIAAGHRTLAIRWYGRLRSALEANLGVVPSAETQRLYAQCIAGLESSAPAFVGREVELATAQKLLHEEEASGTAALLLRGPAGVGKTAFAQELVALAKKEGWGTAFITPSDDTRPYGVVADVATELLRSDRRLLDALGPHTRSVLATFTPLARPAVPHPGALARHQMVGALHSLLVALRPGAPILFLVDDADAVDEASADVLLHLARTGMPVRTVLAVRSLSTHRVLEEGVARLLRAKRANVIDLGPLGTEATISLARAASETPLDERAALSIASASGGNPFLAIELARSPKATPAEAITQRLVDVDEETRVNLQRLALAPPVFDPIVASAFVKEEEARDLGVLDRALASGVLEVVDGRYRFFHALVRDALAEQLPPHRRQSVHREAATRLASANVAPALVAHHWMKAGRIDEAATWLFRAARDAFAVAAFGDALRHLEPLLAYDKTHAEGLRLRAESFDALGDLRTIKAYEEAIGAADDVAAGNLRAKRALAQVKMGDPPGALETLKSVVATSVDGRLSEALAYAGAAALGFADPKLGSEKAAECRRLALEAGDTGALVIASWAQAAAAHARGDLHGSVWADLWETHHLPHLAVRVFDGHLCITQRFLYGARPYDQVIAFANALAAEASRLGAARGHAFAVTLRGEAKLLSGRLDDAEEDLLAGARLHRAIGGATGEALSLQRRAELAMHRGQRNEAWALVHAALDVARNCDIGFHLLDRIYGTRIALARDPDTALAELVEGESAVRGPLETCPGCRITFAVPATVAAARAGELELAGDYEKTTEFLAKVVMKLPAWDAALDEVRGHTALASGDKTRAARLFEAAEKRFEAAGHPLDARRCRALLAG